MAVTIKQITETMDKQASEKIFNEMKEKMASFFPPAPSTYDDGEGEFLDLADGDEVGAMPVGDDDLPVPMWKPAPPQQVYYMDKDGPTKSTGSVDWIKLKQSFSAKQLAKKKKMMVALEEPAVSGGPMLFNGKAVKSQKARGVLLLNQMRKQYNHDTAGMWVIQVNQLLKLDGPISPFVSFPQFARPCPITPRHGFVESRVVKSVAELQQVIDETKAADPDGEVMLMDFMKAELNAVWTPALLTIGRGHDGATGGKGAMTFPLTGKWDKHIHGLAPKCGVDDFPYVEVVFRERTYGSYAPAPFLTQLRNGPVLDSKPDYIPEEVVVTRVIRPDVEKGDLLEWEKVMLESRGVPGVVVWHPGGSQGDHFSVHARSCGVACITSKEPVVGEILQRVEVIEPDYQAVLKGLVAGAEITLENGNPEKIRASYSDVATTMLVGLHNSSAMEGEQAWWLGAAAALMLRLGSMALRGEARHLNPSKGSREGVYHKAAKMTMQAHHQRTNALINIFRYGWGQGAKGIGGIAWAQCGLSLANLFNAMDLFVKAPGKDSYGGLLRAFNVTVNQAHNGGWWMNKFVQKEMFDQAQEGSIKTLMDAVPFMWRLNQEYQIMTDGFMDRVVGQWKRWSPITLAPSKLTTVVGNLSPNGYLLTINAKDRLIGKRRPGIKLDLKNVLSKVPSGWVPEFDLVEGDEGMALEMVFPGKMVQGVVVWREAPLTTQVPVEKEEGEKVSPPTPQPTKLTPLFKTSIISSSGLKKPVPLGVVSANNS